jgi:hypothetical protein
METPQEMLEDARLRGRSEAETFDRELRERELRDREARLTRLAWAAEDLEAPGSWTAGQGAGSDVVWRLQQDLERLSAFHRAVLNSRAWRLIQMARRPFGRAW